MKELAVDEKYPTFGCEDQWLLPVVQNAVDTTDPSLHTGYPYLYISVAHGVYIHCIHFIHVSGDFLLMPNVNGM